MSAGATADIEAVDHYSVRLIVGHVEYDGFAALAF